VLRTREGVLVARKFAARFIIDAGALALATTAALIVAPQRFTVTRPSALA
jgi:hypothetical protein